jgi:membrane protein DedA with SNARE-associated domain
VRVAQRASRGVVRYPMPRLPLWFVLRALVWNAVLIWIFVMVGKQFVRDLQWPTDWQTGLAGLIAVLVTVLVIMWLVKPKGRLAKKVEGGDKKQQG